MEQTQKHKREGDEEDGGRRRRSRNNKNANDFRSGRNDKGIKTESTNMRALKEKFF